MSDTMYDPEDEVREKKIEKAQEIRLWSRQLAKLLKQKQQQEEKA